MAYLDSGSARIHYTVVPGLVPADTLLIHGNLATSRWWEPAVAAWRRRHQDLPMHGRLISADWRGLGGSRDSLSAPVVDFEVCADDYAEVLARLGCDRVRVVGHSAGALITLHLMLRHPGLVEAAAVIGSIFPSQVSLPRATPAAIEALRTDRALLTAALAATITGVDAGSGDFTRLVEDACGCAPHIWHGVPAALLRTELAADLPRIGQPVLCLHGQLDPVMPFEGSVRLARALSRGVAKLLPGLGHTPQWERPGYIVDIIENFFSSAMAAAAGASPGGPPVSAGDDPCQPTFQTPGPA